jgi:hypothetical protein
MANNAPRNARRTSKSLDMIFIVYSILTRLQRLSSSKKNIVVVIPAMTHSTIKHSGNPCDCSGWPQSVPTE